MAEVAVHYMIERLSVLIITEDIKLIEGVEEAIDDLVGDLLDMKAFLKDASKIDSDTPSWKVALREIRNVVYEAENVVDKFLIEVNVHQDQPPIIKFFNQQPFREYCPNITSVANAMYDKYEILLRRLLHLKVNLTQLQMGQRMPFNYYR